MGTIFDVVIKETKEFEGVEFDGNREVMCLSLSLSGIEAFHNNTRFVLSRFVPKFRRFAPGLCRFVPAPTFSDVHKPGDTTKYSMLERVSRCRCLPTTSY